MNGVRRRRRNAAFLKKVQEAGGYLNAYTSFDRTVYHIDVPDTGATVAIDILCDIMQHATLPPDELAKELDVIRREMDMGQDDPGRRSSKRLFETAYTHSLYRFPIIGVPDIFVEHGTQAGLRAKYGLDAKGIAKEVLALFPDTAPDLPLTVEDKASKS